MELIIYTLFLFIISSLIFPKIIIILSSKFPSLTYIFGIISTIIAIIVYSMIAILLYAFSGEGGKIYQTKFAFLTFITNGIIFYVVYFISNTMQKLWKIDPIQATLSLWFSIILTFPLSLIILLIFANLFFVLSELFVSFSSF